MLYRLLYNEQRKTLILIGLEEYVIIDARLTSSSGVTGARDQSPGRVTGQQSFANCFYEKQNTGKSSEIIVAEIRSDYSII